MVPNLGIFFHEMLDLEKFEDADFKYDNSFVKTLSQKLPIKANLVKNTQIRHLLVPNLAFFISSQNFAIRQIPGY